MHIKNRLKQNVLRNLQRSEKKWAKDKIVKETLLQLLVPLLFWGRCQKPSKLLVEMSGKGNNNNYLEHNSSVHSSPNSSSSDTAKNGLEDQKTVEFRTPVILNHTNCSIFGQKQSMIEVDGVFCFELSN